METPRTKTASKGIQQQNSAILSEARRRQDTSDLGVNRRSQQQQQQPTRAFHTSPTNLQNGVPRRSSNNSNTQKETRPGAPRLYHSPRHASSRQFHESLSAPVSRSSFPMTHSESKRSQARSNLLVHNKKELRQHPRTHDSSSSLSTAASATSPNHVLHKDNNSNPASHTNISTRTSSPRVSYPLPPHVRIESAHNTEANISVTLGNERERIRGVHRHSLSASDSGSSCNTTITGSIAPTLRMRSERLEEITGVPESTVDRLNLPLWTLSVQGQKFQPPRHQDRVVLSTLPREAQAVLVSLHKSLDPIDLEHIPASQDKACCAEMFCSALSSLIFALRTPSKRRTLRQRKLSTIPLDSQIHLLTSANAKLSKNNLHVILVREEQSCPGSIVLSYFLEVKTLQKENMANLSISNDTSENGKSLPMTQSGDNIDMNSDKSEADDNIKKIDKNEADENINNIDTNGPDDNIYNIDKNEAVDVKETPGHARNDGDKQCSERLPINTSATAETQSRRRSISKMSNHTAEDHPDDKVIMRRTLLHSRSKMFGTSTSSLISNKSTSSNTSGDTNNTANRDDNEDTQGLGRITEGGIPPKVSGNSKYLRLLNETQLETPATSDFDTSRPMAARPDQELTVRDLLKATRKWTSFSRSRTYSSGSRSGSLLHSDSTARRRSGSTIAHGLSHTMLKWSKKRKPSETSSVDDELKNQQDSGRAGAECDKNRSDSRESGSEAVTQEVVALS